MAPRQHNKASAHGMDLEQRDATTRTALIAWD